MAVHRTAGELSDAFTTAVLEVEPTAVRPDIINRSAKSPDLFLPKQKIAFELKSVSVKLADNKPVGEKIRAAKRQDFVVFGTAKVQLDYRESLVFSEKMSGKLRQRIAEAEKQLSIFFNDDDILTVCCLFVHISKVELFEWNKSYPPSREMVRLIADTEFKKRKLDCLLLFAVDEASRVSIDCIQAVYAEGHLQNSYDEFERLLGEIISHLDILPDRSVRPEFFFSRTRPSEDNDEHV